MEVAQRFLDNRGPTVQVNMEVFMKCPSTVVCYMRIGHSPQLGQVYNQLFILTHIYNDLILTPLQH